MAITKTSSTFMWSGSSTTSSSGTSSSLPCNNDYAQQAYVLIQQTGAAASAAANFTVSVSPDGTTFYPLTTITAGTALGNYTWVIDLPITAEAVEIVFVQCTGTSAVSTISGQLGQVTGV